MSPPQTSIHNHQITLSSSPNLIAPIKPYQSITRFVAYDISQSLQRNFMHSKKKKKPDFVDFFLWGCGN